MFLLYDRYRLRPRCLRDVSHRVTRTSILGHNIEFPVGVSPTASHGVIHKDGEKATARGTKKSNEMRSKFWTLETQGGSRLALLLALCACSEQWKLTW